MPTEALTPEIRRSGEVSERRFDPRSAAPFVYKSTSEETRRAYRRTLLEFFRFNGMKHPAGVSPAEVLRWREALRAQRKGAATVAFKLSVVRSFFEHLRAGGAVTLNPAATRLVPPPEVSSQPAGRALSVKEVRYLLAGPDRGKAEGARDYALMLVMLRLSLRVSEEDGHHQGAGLGPHLPAGADDVEAQGPEDRHALRPRQGELGTKRRQLP